MSTKLTKRTKKDTEVLPKTIAEPTKKRDVKASKKVVDIKDDIPNDAPAGKYCGSGSIEVMLAQTYDPDRDDPSGWLMSEKMDGVRCYWSGSCLYTRTGKIIYAPNEWKACLPKMALDGELWSGRDDF
jgi:hypothetical protein